MSKGELELADFYPKEELKIEIKSVLKKDLYTLSYINPELIKNSVKKSSTKRNTHSDSSSCDSNKKKKQDKQKLAPEEATAVSGATLLVPTSVASELSDAPICTSTETNSNGV